MVAPQAKRIIVDYLKLKYQFSERKSCRLIHLSRTSLRYQAKPNKDSALSDRLKELAANYPMYGYLFLHSLLKREGLVVDKKRTHRLYTQSNLQVRTKHRKKIVRPLQTKPVLKEANQRWSMDFVSDQLSDGRRFRVLNVIDEFSRECIGQLVNFSISGTQVSRFLSKLIENRGIPQSIVCDNGTEFTSKAMFFWSKQMNVRLDFIQPGKPTQNAFVESFNGKFRLACLNQHWFRTLDEAEYEISQWRKHYNLVRPHSSLNYLTPYQFSILAA